MHQEIKSLISQIIVQNRNGDWSWTYQYPTWIPWVILPITFLCSFVACIVFVLYLKHRKESSVIPTWVTITGLTLISSCLIIIPIDIFNISHNLNPRTPAIIIRILYYLSYILLLVYAFLLVPFAYFFYEEGGEEIPFDIRAWGAFKYTIFTLIIGALILATVLVLRLIDFSPESPAGWIRGIVDAENFGSQVFGFIGAILAFIGLLPWYLYTGIGLGLLPIGLIKKPKSISVTMGNITEEIENIKEQIHTIKQKYEMTGKPKSTKDEKKIDTLRKHLRYFKNRNRRLSEENNSCWTTIECCIYPMKLLLGIFILLIICFIMVSYTLTLVDRIFSPCHFTCGFLTSRSIIPNPLDLLLTYSSMVFPLDYIIFSMLILVVLWGTITGLQSFGISFLCIKLYKIKGRGTVPQGLLTACIFLMFVVITFSFALPTFTPQYATFGSQRYQDSEGNWLQCTYEALNATTNAAMTKNSTQIIKDHCHISVLATLVNGVGIRIGIVGTIFYFTNWLFIAAFIFGIIIAFVKKPLSYEELVSDDDDESDFMSDL